MVGSVRSCAHYQILSYVVQPSKKVAVPYDFVQKHVISVCHLDLKQGFLNKRLKALLFNGSPAQKRKEFIEFF